MKSRQKPFLRAVDPSAEVFLKPQSKPGRVADLVGAVFLFAGAFVFGMYLAFMIVLFASKDCTGRCGTYLYAGIGLMTYATYIVELVVLVLMVWSWRRRRVVSVWPKWSFLVLAVVAVVSWLIVIFGPHFPGPGGFLPAVPSYLPSLG
ncbi:hypothetical protein [Nocardia iowensis]|uniref:Uncharacterized protein n=1 Tax=Nocardia iowensis TaxID=204891 RepID=A0ABX8RU23_NOCIO|nr:hypothetical protein [Nocardia iowensis]QXN93143.1 hypothetical protein KV110_08575 [Nocardia iowensis]